MKTNATSNKKSATSRSAASKKSANRTTNGKTASRSQGKNDQKDAAAKENTPFEKLFQDMLKDIYWAEKELVSALEKMADEATTDELQSAFEDHMYVTQKHVRRLEKVFTSLGLPAEGKKCDAMAGLIKEGERVMQETEKGTMTRDAGLIISAQKIEHYEIAAYGSLVQVALTLGHNQEADLLEKTLNEEEDTDRLLTEIAETEVNPMADEEDMTGEEENAEEYASIEM